MKKLTDKNFIQKIIIAILIVLSFNFVAPTLSRADFGGVLLGPVIDLIAGIGDCFMALMQTFMDVDVYKESISGEIGGVEFEVDASLKGTKAIIAQYNDVVDKSNSKEHKPMWKSLQEDSNLKYAPDIDAKDLDRGWFGFDSIALPTVSYSPEKIFSNKVPALDANFINPKDFGEEGNNKSIAFQLRETISSWYQGLRNLVIVCLLSVLLYVAIRMIISSTASDKAKYKQMIMDWLIALCLLFFLHYIMLFTMTLVETITDGLGKNTEMNMTIKNADGDTPITMKTNLIGLCRMQVQYKDLGQRVIYLIFYIALVVYTVKFTWEYIKRAVTMAFLTLIAPLVVLTYPIDKIGDGKAQAFNMWLKEYIFNALLQPFHLIIYTIFVGSAMDMILVNPLYAIFFLAFITPAEKLLRKFFGFDKASTAGASFAGGFGGAAAFNALKNTINRGAKAIGASSSASSKGGNNIRQQKPVEDVNAPKGYTAFAKGNNQDQNLPKENTTFTKGNTALAKENTALAKGNNQNEIKKQTTQQRLLDAYDENYGTDEWNPQEREALARNYDSGINNNENGYTDAEYANLLRESGYTEEEIAEKMDMGNIEGQTPTLESKTQEQQKTNRNIFGAIGMGALGAAKYTGRNLKQRFATKDGWKKNAKLAGRITARTLGAGIGATVGLGMGIAGDDLEDVFKYGAAGTALGGSAIGNMAIGTASKVANSGVIKAASQSAREYKYGGVNAAQLVQQGKELESKGELREYIGNNITHEDGTRLKAKELKQYEKRAIEHYNAGVTDFSSIKKTLKLEDSINKDLANNNDMTEEERLQLAKDQASTIAKIADHVNDQKLMADENYAMGLQQNFARGLRKASPTMSERDVDREAAKMMKMLKTYKKID